MLYLNTAAKVALVAMALSVAACQTSGSSRSRALTPVELQTVANGRVVEHHGRRYSVAISNDRSQALVAVGGDLEVLQTLIDPDVIKHFGSSPDYVKLEELMAVAAIESGCHVGPSSSLISGSLASRLAGTGTGAFQSGDGLEFSLDCAKPSNADELMKVLKP